MDWSTVAGIGVAGNFTGHLEQAGEAKDFVNVRVKEKNAPKGVFPFYLPNGSGHFLNTMPMSSSEIRLKNSIDNHQIEPELALLCTVAYDEQKVVQITPLQAMAYNDCSIRKAGVPKISLKKNWGPCSKGVSEQCIDLDQFSEGGRLDNFNITSYLRRGDQLHQYGLDSPVIGYQYFYSQLIDWLMRVLREQQDEGPLENMAEHLRAAGLPNTILVSVGATKYTAFGEQNFLRENDVAYVVLYDRSRYDEATLQNLIETDSYPTVEHISVLKQVVIGPQQ